MRTARTSHRVHPIPYLTSPPSPFFSFSSDDDDDTGYLRKCEVGHVVPVSHVVSSLLTNKTGECPLSATSLFVRLVTVVVNWLACGRMPLSLQCWHHVRTRAFSSSSLLVFHPSLSPLRLPPKSRTRLQHPHVRARTHKLVSSLFNFFCLSVECTVLDLSNHGLGFGGATALAAALDDNETLVEIRLSGNSIGNQGGIAVARALAANDSVRTLDISRFAAPTG